MKHGCYNALLVVDDPQVIDLARNAVAESCHGLDLTIIEGIEAALDWLADSASKNKYSSNIVLLDMKFPKLDGLAMLRTMRNYPALRDVPIVVFSTEYTQADVLMSYQAGANSFVAKPADHVQFGELLREQLAYWMQRRQRKMPIAAAGDAAGLI